MLLQKNRKDEVSEDDQINAMLDAELPKPQKLGASIGADIERIKAQIDAINDMRKSYSEKFSHVAEQIGELRTMLIEKEKQIRNIEVKAIKASDLVESVQPEKLMIEIKKEDVKIETIKSKLDGYGAIAEKIRDELKEMRNSISSFRGIEQTIEMNKEIRSDIMKIKKIESSVEIHADKVESIFGAVQKNFDEYKRYEDLTNTLNEGFKSMLKEFNEVKTNSQSKVQKNEFADFKSDMGKKMIYFDTMLTHMKESIETMQKGHDIMIKKIDGAEPIKMAERMNSAVARDDLQKELARHKEEILWKVEEMNKLSKASNPQAQSQKKNDVSKTMNLIDAAGKAMKKKDTEEVKKIYSGLKDEYESLTAARKNEVYDDIRKVYDWISASE